MKNDKMILNNVRWCLLLAAVMTLIGAAWFVVDVVEMVNASSASENQVADFLKGFSSGVTMVGFFVVLAIFYQISKTIKAKNIFSPRVIHFCQVLGFLLLLSGVSGNVADYLTEGGMKSNYYTIIAAFMVIIFAQMMKLGYKMQQEQELTI